jgi:hypothetical protein
MAEREPRGVEHDARSGGGVTAVSAVPEDGHPRGREVKADLVLAARARTGLDEQAARQHFHDRKIGHGRP